MHFLSKWKWELFLPISGLFLTLAFAPFEYSYLAIFSLTLVFLSWLECTPTRAAVRGYLYGLGMYGSGISWVYISIHDYGGAPKLGAILLTLFVIGFWALFPALTGYLSVKVAAKQKKKLIWLIPFIWIFIEYFRGYWLLNGFPWLQIAYTQMDMPLQGFIPILGVYGTGFLLAISASIIVASFKRTLNPLYAILIITSLWGTGVYLQTIQWTTPIGKEIKVALIQGNIPQDQKWLPQNRMQTLLFYKQMTENNWDADVIILPETAIPTYLFQVKESYLTPLSVQAKSHNTDVIVGIKTFDKENNIHFNSVVTLGNHEGQYNKTHLLPFGEYLPLQPLSGFVLNLLNIQLGSFASGGDEQKLLTAGGYPFATSICYEDAFGDEVLHSLPEATFLVNVTNDAWFGDSLEPYQHMQIAQMRSLETGRHMLRTTNTGVTAIVAPNGKIVKAAPLFRQFVLKGKITPMGGMTPYSRIGDTVILIFLGFCLLGLKMKSILITNEISSRK